MYFYCEMPPSSYPALITKENLILNKWYGCVTVSTPQIIFMYKLSFKIMLCYKRNKSASFQLLSIKVRIKEIDNSNSILDMWILLKQLSPIPVVILPRVG